MDVQNRRASSPASTVPGHVAASFKRSLPFGVGPALYRAPTVLVVQRDLRTLQPGRRPRHPNFRNSQRKTFSHPVKLLLVFSCVFWGNAAWAVARRVQTTARDHGAQKPRPPRVSP